MDQCPNCGHPIQGAPPPVTFTQLTDRFWFGKHRGELIEDVLESDPQYLIWAHENVDGINLDQATLSSARQKAASSAPPRAKQRSRSWGSPHDDDDYDWGESLLDYGDDIPF